MVLRDKWDAQRMDGDISAFFRNSGCAAVGIGIYCDEVKLKVPLQEAYKIRSFTYFCGKS